MIFVVVAEFSVRRGSLCWRCSVLPSLRGKPTFDAGVGDRREVLKALGVCSVSRDGADGRNKLLEEVLGLLVESGITVWLSELSTLGKPFATRLS